jgi:hypothetical protein
MSDLLEQATRALRETTADPQPRSGLTKARVLDSAEKRYAPKRGGGGVLRWAVTLLAALAASTALARVAQYWPEIKRALVSETVEHSDAAPAKKRKAAKKPAQPAAAEQQPEKVEPVVVPQEAPAEVPVPEASAPSESAVPVAEGAAERASSAAERASSAVERVKPAVRRAKVTPKPVIGSESVASVRVEPVATPAPPVVKLAPVPDAESADLVLFRRAQRLHLNRDPRALAAWDDYLRVAGEAPLAPEARYNRALCLVRLGRRAEAKEALEPFANGAYGTYRKAEAKALITALGASN